MPNDERLNQILTPKINTKARLTEILVQDNKISPC